MLTLGAAAKLTGLNRTTVLRAIKSGRLSAARQDDGSYRIDPAELERVYTIRLTMMMRGEAHRRAQ